MLLRMEPCRFSWIKCTREEDARACRTSSDKGTYEYKQAVSCLKEYIGDWHTPKHGWHKLAQLTVLMITR